VTAGAIISGAYFGDKISPLSETTNLAPAIAGTNLFEHIQYMLWTTVPSIIITLILFVVIGLGADLPDTASGIEEMQGLLQQEFNLGLHMLVPLLVLLTMAIKKVPAFPTVFIGALLGAVWAVFFQQELLAQCAMCKAVLESNMQSGEDAVGKGINSGIMYIMFVPYILLGTIGYFMYKHFKKTNQSVNN
jgi:NhaC family Na+:H+ antiporter